MTYHEFPRGVVLNRPEQYDGERSVTIVPWMSVIDEDFTVSARRRRLREWIAFLEQPTSITSLTVYTGVTQDLVNALSTQKQLTGLELKWGKVTDLFPLTEMAGLEDLRVCGASMLSDLSPLQGISGLRHLEIEQTPRVRDYGPLHALSDLRLLHVGHGITGHRSSADSLEFVRGLRSIETLWWDPRVLSLDYSPLLALEHAHEIGITQTKGMSPPLVDLEWALPGVRAYEKRRAEQTIPLVMGSRAAAIIRDITGRQKLVDLGVIDDGDDSGPGPEALWTFDESALSHVVTGRMIRLVTNANGVPNTEFLLLRDGADVDPDSPDRSPTEYRFVAPAGGPALVYDRIVDEPDTGSFPIDATAMSALSADEFWQPFEAMGGRLGTMVVTRLEKRLAQESEEFILRWAKTFADHALRLKAAVAHLLMTGVIRPHQTTDAIAVAIGYGQDRFESVLADPGLIKRGMIKPGMIEVIWAAQGALFRRDGRYRGIVTSLVPIRLAAREFEHRWFVECGMTKPPVRTGLPLLRATRAVVETGGVYRERIVCVHLDPSDTDGWLGRCVEAVESFGGRIVAGPEISPLPPRELTAVGAVFVLM